MRMSSSGGSRSAASLLHRFNFRSSAASISTPFEFFEDELEEDDVANSTVNAERGAARGAETGGPIKVSRETKSSSSHGSSSWLIPKSC